MRAGISGARGIVGDDLGPGDVSALCDSFCAAAGAPECALGSDTRESGSMLSLAAAASLARNGIGVLDYGIAPTPVVFRESRRAGAGIVVTASHNPPEWNGLKFALRGRGIDAGALGGAPEPRACHGRVGPYAAAQSPYADDAASLVGKVERRISVALDAGGGAALGTARDVLERIGCEVITVDSSRGPDPTAGGLDELARASRGCELGLGFDLDGDRVVIARGGRIQAPDATLAAGTAWSLDRGCKRFAASEDTSAAVPYMIGAAGARMWQADVGEANVVAAMDKNACGAGGEGSSAGFILPEFNYCRDGILAGAIAAAMAASGRLDAALGAVSELCQIRTKVAAPAGDHGGIIESVRDEMEEEFEHIWDTGRFRGEGEDSSWMLVRGSNTEEAVRVSAESPDAARARELAERACAAARRHVEDGQ